MQNALKREGRIWIRGALDDITLTKPDTLLELDGRPGTRITGGSAGHTLGGGGQVGQVIQQIYP
ncbi:hypothetical protein MNBD_ALPHA07-1303 [hydrothermal vent metagenome]|uniref:Uncharacterized protein n=1 Tax=hydrothermal vent metagenome TaxID=652676 RepID=A0A3B0SBL3_9ZZZZ